MFIPNKKELKKLQKKKIKTSAQSNNYLAFGDFGLKIMENYFITSKQLEMSRIILSKHTKKIGKFWIKVFPHSSVTAKPLEVRMGKGKGHISFWISKLKRGAVLFELSGLSKKSSIFVLRKLAVKLPFRTSIIIKNA